MNSHITYLYDDKLFEPIDKCFADYFVEISGSYDPEIHLAALLTSWSTRNGNVCLNLDTISDDSQFSNAKLDGSIVFPDTDRWIDKLSSCNAIGNPGDNFPLILDPKNRLYFYRYWTYEQNIANTIKERLGGSIKNIDYHQLKDGIRRLFGPENTHKIDMQKIAVISAVEKKFLVISGGPGTGKTTTVAKIIAMLIELAGTRNISILLCAPTGKAAASLSDTIRSAKKNIQCDDIIKNAIPDEAFTIHRLLINIPGSPYFRHDTEYPLQADTVIIDEASMVDVALMAKLFNAIPKKARIILVGDKDQLSSVEAGSVLGDICNRKETHRNSEEVYHSIQGFLLNNNFSTPVLPEQKKSMADHIIVLDKNFRFNATSGIAGLSAAVNCGDSNRALGMLTNPEEKGIELLEIGDHTTLYQTLNEIVLKGYSRYLTADDPYQALHLLNHFKILCPLKSGPFGVDVINKVVQNILQENNLIRFDNRRFDHIYKGRPILITRNDYSIGLFNGDTGIIMADSCTKDGELKAIFTNKKNDIIKVPLHRLPDHETAYAMTIHKSQGSEFNDVLIILPDKYYPLLTRELIYTGITRAMKSVVIWGSQKVLKKSIEHKIERTSGLRDALWENSEDSRTLGIKDSGG